MSADLIDSLNAALAGRYHIEAELGEGGMATVYLAADLKHERKVALKVLKPGVAVAIGPERFLAEIKTTANLQHPAVLPLHDSGVADGHVFYAMPYVKGASLKDRLAEVGPLPIDEVIRITTEIGAALAYAHSEGLVHRDIKPGNILLSEGHAVLADFGLAKALFADGMTETGGVGGTVSYMSPEQIQGDSELDGRADQYSLACVVYEMLAGERPFTGSSPWEVIARQASGDVQSLAANRPEAASLDVVLGKALAVDPNDRFARTEDFTREVVERLSGRPGSKIKAPGRARRRALLGLGVAAAAAAAAFFWLRPGPAVDPDTVMVFPLMDQRAGRVDQAVGEQVAIMVGTALEHAEPLRWMDGWDWLSPAERADMSAWSIRNGTAIAREQGAGYVIDGRIMDEGDSVSVLLRLHDAGSREQVQTSLLSGRADELPSLGRQALVSLLPNLIDPGRSVGEDAFEGFAPEVVADWLNGEREYRESRFEAAFASFQSAVEGDSTMALAAIRGAQAARWVFDNEVAVGLLDVALANEASLTPRYSVLTRGIQSYVNGDAAEAERLLRGVAEDDPSWSDAWMALGEVYYHLQPTLGPGVVRAEDAFNRALAGDPGFTPPLVHLSELAYRRGDADRGDSLRAVFNETGDGTVLASQLDLMSACVRSGPDAPEWSRVAGSQQGGEAVLYAGAHLAVAGAYTDCAIGAFEALHAWGGELEGGGVRNQAIAMEWSTLIGLQSLHAARGHHERVRELVSGADQFERPRDYLWVLAAMTGLPLEEEARDAVTRLEMIEEPSPTALWVIGAWHALNGEPEAVEGAARTARDWTGTTRPDSVPVYTLLADALDAWSSLARADTTQAIERFAALTPVSPPSELQWSLWEPLPAERLELARLLVATGEFEGAIEAASVFDHPQPVVYVGFLAESLRLRVEAAEGVSDAGRAEGYRARLARLR